MSTIDIQFCTQPWQDKDVLHLIDLDRKTSVDLHQVRIERKASVVVVQEIIVDNEESDEEIDEEPQRVLVRLPDLFCTSFGVVRDAAVNSSYEEVRKVSEAWVAEYVY